jgi:hypothetical protein
VDRRAEVDDSIKAAAACGIGPAKNKVEKSGVFLNPEIRVAKNHKNALIHHVMTTKNHPKNTSFFKPPFKKARKSKEIATASLTKFFCKNAKDPKPESIT